MTISSVAVVGLGKLGAPIAASIASAGIAVVGVDANPETVRLIADGRPPVSEPGLDELLRSASGHLEATTDTAAATARTDATIIVVPTPSREDGGFSLKHVLPVCEDIGRGLKDSSGRHVIVLTSTVLPGATGGEVRDALEGASGKRCGEEFGLCYSPEFVALGSVIRDFLHPDLLLIGESDPQSGELLQDLYLRVTKSDPPAMRMNLVNAEIAKLAVNTFITTKIAFGNMLGELCASVDGGNVDVVTAAIGLDRRIGRQSLKAGLGYGGPCFPRDNVALSSFARSRGIDPAVPEGTDRANRSHLQQIIDLVSSHLRPGGRLAVLGLSYKPDSEVVERSQALEMAIALASGGADVIAYDPAIRGDAPVADGIVRADSLDACVRDADLIVLATPWPEFKAELAGALERSPRQRVVIDCWRELDPSRLTGDVRYVAFGVT